MAAASKISSYQARPANAEGMVNYNRTENQTWQILSQRQNRIIENRASVEYLHGLNILQLPTDRIAQIPEVNSVLQDVTGWQLEPVAAVIPFGEFFNLLSQRKFPAATFIRRAEDIDYLQEPDIFHEIYGHCPMLTDPVFADFVQAYGVLGCRASPRERVYLARLFWFSVEFGLINTEQGIRAYGAGILSSHGETVYALEDTSPERKPWDVMTVLRTPYRIDIMQPVYYQIESYQQLYQAMEDNLMDKVHEAMELGLFAPSYTLPSTNIKQSPDKHDC